MSSGNVFAVVVALAAGFAGAMQAAVQGKLGERIGTIEALGFATLVAALVGVTVLLVVRQSFAGIAAGLRAPAWLWVAGALSAFFILAISIAAPRIGVTASIGLIIAGQLAMAAIIDRFGLLGAERIAIHWPRLLGIALLAAGAALSLKK